MGSFGQKELQKVGGVAGPCGLIRVSWGLHGLRSCPPSRLWDRWPEAQKSRKESPNSAASVVLE